MNRNALLLAQLAACFTAQRRARHPDLVLLGAELQRKLGRDRLPATFEPVEAPEMVAAYVAKLKRPPSCGPVPDLGSSSISPERASRLYHDRLRHPCA